MLLPPYPGGVIGVSLTSAPMAPERVAHGVGDCGRRGNGAALAYALHPAWAHNALGGLPAAINPGIFLDAKTIAATFLDLLTEPGLLKTAQDARRAYRRRGRR